MLRFTACSGYGAYDADPCSRNRPKISARPRCYLWSPSCWLSSPSASSSWCMTARRHQSGRSERLTVPLCALRASVLVAVRRSCHRLQHPAADSQSHAWRVLGSWRPVTAPASLERVQPRCCPSRVAERLSSSGPSRSQGSRRCRPEYRRPRLRADRRPRPREYPARARQKLVTNTRRLAWFETRMAPV